MKTMSIVKTFQCLWQANKIGVWDTGGRKIWDVHVARMGNEK